MSIAITICPHCGAENLPDGVTCTACGESLGSSLKTLNWVSVVRDLLAYGLAVVGIVLGGVFSAVIAATFRDYHEAHQSRILWLFITAVGFFLGSGISFKWVQSCKGRLLPTLGVVALISIVGAILSSFLFMRFAFSSGGW